jgi:hypothetical protein
MVAVNCSTVVPGAFLFPKNDTTNSQINKMFLSMRTRRVISDEKRGSDQEHIIQFYICKCIRI